MKLKALILAAGRGKRMKTNLPKCAYPLLGKPMIKYLVDTLRKIITDDQNIGIIVGYQKEIIQDYLGDSFTYIVQNLPLGTADAVKAASSFYHQQDGIMLILPGDMPLISSKTLVELINVHLENHYDLTILTTTKNDPTGYGRIIYENKKVVDIIEEKDATKKIKEIKEVNTGIYCINMKKLEEVIFKIKNNNAAQEYYLTDIVKIMNNVGTYHIKDDFHLSGVNDLVALSKLEKDYQQEINHYHMLNGVHLINPETILIEDTVKIGTNVTIDAFVVIRGKAVIEDNTYIKPFTYIEN